MLSKIEQCLSEWQSVFWNDITMTDSLCIKENDFVVPIFMKNIDV